MKSLFFAVSLLMASALSAVAMPSEGSGVVRIAVQDGQLVGQVFALLSNEKTPLAGKVSLTNEDGKTVSTSKTDRSGNFKFEEVKPGKYMAVGVAGDYVGNTVIEVAVADDSESSDEGYYTALPLAVAPAPATGPAFFETYAALPATSFAQAPVFSGGSSFGGSGCSTCGGGVGLRTYGGGSCGGGGLNFRRLALIGGAVAIPIALSGGNDDVASPDEMNGMMMVNGQ